MNNESPAGAEQSSCIMKRLSPNCGTLLYPLSRFLLLILIFIMSNADSADPDPQPFKRFPLDAGPLVLECPARLWAHVEALGEEAGIWGSIGGDMEAWVYPFKLFGGFTLLVSEDGGDTFRPLSELVRYQWAAPHMAQLRLVSDRFTLTETLFVPRRLPGLVVLLDVDAHVDLEIAVRFRPSLAPMLMSAIEKPVISWHPERGELAAVESGRAVELRIRSPFAVAHESLEGGVEEIRLKVSASEAKAGFVPVFIGASWPNGPKAKSTINTLTTSLEQLFNEALDHYRRLLAQAPEVRSPDTDVNDALAWSVISLDQLRVHNPSLGFGLVSGYSSSGRGARPQYAWFFDEPTLSSWAFHRVGLSRHVREAFRFLQRFQRSDGKTVHEIPQSMAYQSDFLSESPYAYIHTDGPVYFLAAYGHYYRSTGDLSFIREQWPKILKALQWCFSVTDDSDGLIRIEPKDWGSAESSFGVWKDTQLEGMWVKALREMTGLSHVMGDDALASRCESLAKKASASIEEKLWDEKTGMYLWGLDRAGRPLRSLVPHTAVSAWMGSFRSDRAKRLLEKMGGSDFRTDWGVRSLSLSDPAYDPSAYQTGSVWPVWNAGVIVGDYRHDRPVEAFRTWRAMLRLRTLDALGPMPEVLHGRYCKRLENGVPHQMFSEIAVQNGFYDGLLGLEVDVPAASVKVAPCLPPVWNGLEVKRIPLGPGSLHLDIRKGRGTYDLAIDLRFPGGCTALAEPSLPAGCTIQAVTLDGQTCPSTIRNTPSATIVSVNLGRFQGKRSLRITYRGGIEFFPVDSPLVSGGQSRNLRVVRAAFIDGEWQMLLEGLPQEVYAVDFFTDREPLAMSNAELAETQRGRLRVLIRPPADAERRVSGFVRWRTAVRWPPPEAGTPGQ